MVSSRKRRIKTPILRLVCCGLSMGLLITIAGCGKSKPNSAEHVDVTGKVLFQGKPLPGGLVSFVAVNGGFAYTGLIDENGNYEVQAPVGEVIIGVENRMLLQTRGAQENGGPQLKAAESQKEQSSKSRVKGRWVEIPENYSDPTKSGLKYTVKPEPQTHDIDLSANPPAAAASGS